MPQVMTVLPPSPQFVYVFTLGMVAVFNPCGFPLLPAYLELFTTGTAEDGPARRAARAVYAGAFATLGFLVLFGLVGTLFELGWSAVADHAVTVARYLMAALGVAMVVAAVSWLLQRPLRLNLPHVRSGLGLRRPLALGVFGLSYGLASLGCALPLFISGVATTFTTTGLVKGTTVFLAYGLGMGVLLSALALVVALVGPAAARALRPVSRVVPTLGALALGLVGLYLASYWGYAIVSPTSTSPAESWVSSVQSALASYVGDHTTLVTVVAGGLVVAAVLAGGLWGQHRSDAKGPGPEGSLTGAGTPTAAEMTGRETTGPTALADATALPSGS